MAGLSHAGTPTVFEIASPMIRAQNAHSRYLFNVNSALTSLTITAITKRTANAGRYSLILPPCSFTPAVKSTARTRNVLRSFTQNAPVNCDNSSLRSATFSHKCHVENFVALKSNAPVRTEIQPKDMIINPIHTYYLC